MHHPQIDDYAKKQKNIWEVRDNAFQEAINDFQQCTKIAMSYYKEKTTIMHTNNFTNTSIDKENNNNEVNVLSNNVNMKLDSADGFCEEIINSFRQLNEGHKRIVFTFIMEKMNEVIAEQNSKQ